MDRRGFPGEVAKLTRLLSFILSVALFEITFVSVFLLGNPTIFDGIGFHRIS